VVVKVAKRHRFHLAGNVLQVENYRRVHIGSQLDPAYEFTVDVTINPLNIMFRQHGVECFSDPNENVDAVILRNHPAFLGNLNRRNVLYRAFFAFLLGIFEHIVFLSKRAFRRTASRAFIRGFANGNMTAAAAYKSVICNSFYYDFRQEYKNSQS